jgi:hypothetical protein
MAPNPLRYKQHEKALEDPEQRPLIIEDSIEASRNSSLAFEPNPTPSPPPSTAPPTVESKKRARKHDNSVQRSVWRLSGGPSGRH